METRDELKIKKQKTEECWKRLMSSPRIYFFAFVAIAGLYIGYGILKMNEGVDDRDKKIQLLKQELRAVKSYLESTKRVNKACIEENLEHERKIMHLEIDRRER